MPGIRPSPWAVALALSGVAVLIRPANLWAQQYESPPEVLRDAARRSAIDIDSAFARTGDAESAAEEVDAVWDRLVFYTAADALPGDELHEIRGLQAYRYMVEVTRTDKQVGATASGPGSTTLSQKPGIVDLLAFAIEHGAVEQSTPGTGITLSTSPYAFVRLFEPDNAENFDQFGFWRRIGVSATFDAQAGSSTPPAVDDIQQLAEWSLRLRVLGDRSTRSPAFTRQWQTLIQPKIQSRLDALTGGVSVTLDGAPSLREAADTAGNGVRSDIARFLTDHASLPPDGQVAGVYTIILDALHSAIYEPLTNGALELSAQSSRDIAGAVFRLGQAHRALLETQTDLGAILDQLDRSLLLTLEYKHHSEGPEPTGFSDLRVLFEDHVAPFDVVANAFLSLHDDPDETVGQEKVRDYGASVDVEGEVPNPFVRRRPAMLVEPITLSVGYQLSRLEDADEAAHLVQARANIPISPGVALPLSLTYASRSVLIDEDHLWGSIGFSLDLDKFYALARALAGS